MGQIVPTQEQEALIAAAKASGSMVVKAFAGTGKTTSLAMLAEASPAQKILYLAFNKSIVGDAEKKMPAKVRVKTFHSLAYGAMGMGSQRSRLDIRLNGGWIAEHFRLASEQLAKGKDLSPAMIGNLVMSALDRFHASAAADLSDQHVPPLRSLFEGGLPAGFSEAMPAWLAVKEIVLRCARKAWAEQCDRGSDFPLTHDAYVKQWALSSPKIDADLILFDEAQDASPVFMQIVQAQKCATVWVGDQHQQIYAWRGAVDALDRVRVDHELYLTKSYRFPPAIAEVATKLLVRLGERRPLIGAGTGQVSDGRRAILTRTNGRAMSEFMRAVLAGEDVSLVGGREMLAQIRQLKQLMEGRPSGAFALFGSWDELVQHSETDAGRDLAPLVKLIDEYGIGDLIRRLDAARERPDARLTISTIHKAKGREWDHVHLTGDWPGAAGVKNGKGAKPLNDEELRLMYVGCTRARVSLDTSEVEPWLVDLASKVTESEAIPPEAEPETPPPNPPPRWLPRKTQRNAPPVARGFTTLTPRASPRIEPPSLHLASVAWKFRSRRVWLRNWML